MKGLIRFFGLAVLAFAQDRPLDNIASRQYQHEIRPLRRALDGWLQTMGLQEMGLSIRLVKVSDLPPNSCGRSNLDLRSGIGEIDCCAAMSTRSSPGASMASVSRVTS